VRPEFWYERWRTGQTGFHQSTVDRQLIRHWPTLRLGAGSHVFVPLCGKSLDMLWLREQGHCVVGVELSALALEAFCMENGIPARRRLRNGFEVYEAENLELFCGDFFALTPAMLEEVTAVYDRAALISWSEELRAPYVRHLAEMLKPGTQILLHALEYPQAQMDGPPFSLERGEIERLFAPYCNIRELDRQDILATEPRLRARGVSELFEHCYLMVRR
jgi:thiopurine S-methyltransferase